MNALRFLWLMCLLGYGLVQALPPVIQLTARTTSLTVWQQAELLVDSTHQLSVLAVMDVTASSFSSTIDRRC